VRVHQAGRSVGGLRDRSSSPRPARRRPPGGSVRPPPPPARLHDGALRASNMREARTAVGARGRRRATGPWEPPDRRSYHHGGAARSAHVSAPVPRTILGALEEAALQMPFPPSNLRSRAAAARRGPRSASTRRMRGDPHQVPSGLSTHRGRQRKGAAQGAGRSAGEDLPSSTADRTRARKHSDTLTEGASTAARRAFVVCGPTFGSCGGQRCSGQAAGHVRKLRRRASRPVSPARSPRAACRRQSELDLRSGWLAAARRPGRAASRWRAGEDEPISDQDPRGRADDLAYPHPPTVCSARKARARTWTVTE